MIHQLSIIYRQSRPNLRTRRRVHFCQTIRTNAPLTNDRPGLISISRICGTYTKKLAVDGTICKNFITTVIYQFDNFVIIRRAS